MTIVRGEWSCEVNFAHNTSGGININKTFVTLRLPMSGEQHQLIIERNGNGIALGNCQLTDGSIVKLTARLSNDLQDFLGDDLKNAAFTLHDLFTGRDAVKVAA